MAEPDPVAGPAPVRPPAPGRQPSRWAAWAARAELWRFLELFALCGFVVVQPLLEIIGDSPDFFIFHGLGPAKIWLLVGVFVLVPPGVLWGAGVLAGLAGPRARRAVHAGMVGGLLVLFAIQLGKHLTDLRGILLLGLALLVAAVMAVGYVRLAVVGQLLRFAAVGPLVFVLLFAVVSPSAAVVFPTDRPSSGGTPEVTGPHPPVVMIVLDELALLSLLADDGEIDADRFPNFAELAGDSTWWRNATTVAGWTPYALPAMLTGQLPEQHAAPHYAVYPDNLFTLLGSVYDVSASETISQLCPPWHCGDQAEAARGGLPVALAESSRLLGELVSPVAEARDPYDDFAEPTVAERISEAASHREERPEFLFAQALAASQPVRFQEFVSALAQPPGPPATSGPPTTPGPPATSGPPGAPAGERPELHFLHLLLPHTPWRYLPDGTLYEAVRGLPVDGPWWGRLALQRHLLQLEYTDLLLGEVLGTLKATGRYDDALVVLTADHGVTLTPGPDDDPWIAGRRWLGPDNLGAEELLWVPLFIKEPGQTTGRVDDRNWQHIDLLPTVADYAGVAVPWETDGISWLREERTDPDKTFVGRLGDEEDIRVLSGPEYFDRILADPGAIPPLPPAPLPELVGTAVAEHPVLAAPQRAEVGNADAFAEVSPEVVPALVHGTLAGAVPEGTPLAIAVNGVIGAVVPVVAGADGPRFAGLVEDVSLFQPGENQLDLFLVVDGTLHQLTHTAG